jgi:hypothetical protein
MDTTVTNHPVIIPIRQWKARIKVYESVDSENEVIKEDSILINYYDYITDSRRWHILNGVVCKSMHKHIHYEDTGCEVRTLRKVERSPPLAIGVLEKWIAWDNKEHKFLRSWGTPQILIRVPPLPPFLNKKVVWCAPQSCTVLSPGERGTFPVADKDGGENCHGTPSSYNVLWYNPLLIKMIQKSKGQLKLWDCCDIQHYSFNICGNGWGK